MSKLLAIFITIFLAELGDKTQLSAMLFATDKNISPFIVFLFTSLALICSTAIAVLIGNYAAKYLETIPLKLIAGILFILIGSYNVFSHFKS
jgi:putative Ca2+/H+ antiporter (TMEM165/GDT1 family)